MMRDLLVHVEGSAAGRDRVRYALDWAERFQARLTGLHITAQAAADLGRAPLGADGLPQDVASDPSAEAKAAAEIFAEESARVGLATDWAQASGDVAQAICRHARCADLVFVGQSASRRPSTTHPLPVEHIVVMRSGRPVVVTPNGVSRCRLDRVIVAWDGSREAVRTVHDALPTLRLAGSVQIVTLLAAGAPSADASDISEHLGRHGVAVDKDVVRASPSGTDARLTRRAKAGDFDAVVMSGYSYPGLFEFLFGSIAEAGSARSRLPVFLSR